MIKYAKYMIEEVRGKAEYRTLMIKFSRICNIVDTRYNMPNTRLKIDEVGRGRRIE